jgi:hypothetical protein
MPNLEIAEGTGRFWAAVFGGITALSLVAAGSYSLVQYWDAQKRYVDDRAKDRATLQLEVAATRMSARQAFANRHLELCAEASAAAATISTTQDQKKRAGATDDFRRLYWGPLGIVEDREVATQMVMFGECLDGECGGSTLRSLSLAIAHACRHEVEKNFEVNLPDVPTQRTAGIEGQESAGRVEPTSATSPTGESR